MSDTERFRLFVSNVSDYAIYMLTPEGIISSWNLGAQRFKGYKESEVLGTNFSRFFTEEDRAAGLPEKALERARKEGRFETEGWRVRKDGSRFWVHAVIDPIHNEQGELIGFAKITRDITERREAAMALERAREALFQSQKMESLGKLTGGVAHDFNNLLAVIVNGVEILHTRLREPEDVKILESMQRAAGRGAKLTQQLLTFARQQPLCQDRHDVNSLLLAFEVVLRRACGETVHFDFHPVSRPRPVIIDATQFEAAVLNLVTNARDAMPHGGVLSLSTDMVTLRQGEVDDLPEGTYVRVNVRDSGVGMSEEVMSLAIDPFFTTKPLGKGTGLGLSQVYGLMQQSSGGMAIDSSPGKGTCVSLYLPALDETAGTEQEPAERALIVDDEPDVLAMAVELFQTLGYEVLSASNGSDALAILERSPDISLLFSDVVMPGMNGMELGKQARGINPGIKVLLASGYAGAMLQENNVDVKTFPLIQKPYRTADLLKQLRKN